MKYVNLIPLIIEIAKIVEVAVPVGGQGKAKLAFVVDAASAIYDSQEDLRASWKDKSAFLAAVTRATASAVALLNASGVFRKTAAAQ